MELSGEHINDIMVVRVSLKKSGEKARFTSVLRISMATCELYDCTHQQWCNHRANLSKNYIKIGLEACFNFFDYKILHCNSTVIVGETLATLVFNVFSRDFFTIATNLLFKT